MNRSFSRLNIYLNRLIGDIYPQPPDDGHTLWAQRLVDVWISHVAAKSVLDVGCGQAFMQPMIEKLGMKYEGVTLGEDYTVSKQAKKNVKECDFTFLPYEDGQFDLIIARHSLEHSPMPIISLMEWHRVSGAWLCIVAPNPAHWGWTGRNHYSLANMEQLKFWLGCAKWSVIWENENHDDKGNSIELWLMCEKEKEQC